MSLLQVITIGGAGEIGKNCTVVRLDDEIIVIDAGLSFPDEDQFGIDIVLPDFGYLRENKDLVKGVFLTHAHEDHVGALPYLMADVKCPVYATEFTAAMVRSKADDRGTVVDMDIKPVKPGDSIEVGAMTVEFIRVTHSVPETCSIAVHTPFGIVLITSDFKFDFTPVDGKLTNVGRFTELGTIGVLLLLSDSTNADRKGWGPSERIVSEGLRKVFLTATGRILITTFASNVHRMQQVLDVAEETGRKVSVAGRRMDMTLELAGRLGYVKIPKGVYVRLDDIGKYRPDQLVILTTGSQGEPMAALSQMSREEYSRMRIAEGDTIIYSARPIPGNEAAIWRTVNKLFKMGANVIYDNETPVHVSGHAYQEELKMMVNLTRPFYIAPIHGESRHQSLYLDMARQMGYPDHRIFTISNGTSLCLDDRRAWIGDEVPTGEVLIDQSGMDGVRPEVMRERTSLGHDGVVVVQLGVNLRTGFIGGRPEIQTRGFSGSAEAIDEVLAVLNAELDGLSPAERTHIETLEKTLTDVLKRSIQRKTQQRPLILPLIVDIPD